MADIQTIFTNDLISRLDGPLHLRFVFQPLIAIGFAFRDGLRDAKKGYPAYGWALLTDPEHRQSLMSSGWKGVSKVFAVAFVLDLIYQMMTSHTIKLLAALIAACLLALIPYVLLRGPINRLMRRRVRHRT